MSLLRLVILTNTMISNKNKKNNKYFRNKEDMHTLINEKKQK